MSDIIIASNEHKFSTDAYEEMEGHFIEKNGRLPLADEAMTLYAIATKICPICKHKFVDRDGTIAMHMIEQHLSHTFTPEDMKLIKVMAKQSKAKFNNMSDIAISQRRV